MTNNTLADDSVPSAKKNKFPKTCARGRLPNGEPNPVDVHIGCRCRLQRELLKLTQDKLAELLGITFQQLQKYEHGYNRISGSRLWDLCQVLDVEPNYFFQDTPKKVMRRSPRMQHQLQTNNRHYDCREQELFLDNPMTRVETLKLVGSYYRIADRQLAEKLFEAILAAAKATEEGLAMHRIGSRQDS